MSLLPVIEAATLKQIPFIRHGFFTRQGGVSQGIYQTLNIGLGSRDMPHHIAQNRALVAAHFGIDVSHLLQPHQYHSADIVTVEVPFARERPQADALVTQVPGLALAVATADCAPVLFADKTKKIIGAAHAGWRGSYGGILENTVTAMEALGSHREDIVAVIGPSIGAPNYQVGEEFFDQFLTQSSDNQRYFVVSKQKNHYLFNLAAYNIERLAQAGVRCTHLDLCTYEDEGRFYSYRRMVHAQETDYGRQISAIMVERT